MGMVSVDALLLSTKEGKVPVPLKNYFSVGADLLAPSPLYWRSVNGGVSRDHDIC